MILLVFSLAEKTCTQYVSVPVEMYIACLVKKPSQQLVKNLAKNLVSNGMIKGFEGLCVATVARSFEDINVKE